MRLTIRHLLPVMLAVALLQGCGGSGNDSASTDPGMVPGQVYTVSTHDRVQNTSPAPAMLEITHELVGGTRTVMLIEGSAELYQ